MCIELTCRVTEKCIVLVKTSIESVVHPDTSCVGSDVRGVSGNVYCVKETVKEVHELIHGKKNA